MSDEHTPFGASDVQVLQRTPGYRGFFALDPWQIRHRLYAGGWSGPFTRELFLRDAAAGVLLYDPLRDEVVLVEQFRIGAMVDAQTRGSSPWLLETVAGIIGPGETAEELVVREAIEEAGCPIRELIHIVDYYNCPGGSNEFISLFCGLVDASNAGGLHGVPEENEDICVRVLSSTQAWQALQEGRLNNAMAIIALQWLQLNREKLRGECFFWCVGVDTQTFIQHSHGVVVEPCFAVYLQAL